ncbi:MAG: hypothetical protein KBT47_05775 [Armatimonadetes bacterium]|nr:hypothetical protein [Candidatus Hippobium faecium]
MKYILSVIILIMAIGYGFCQKVIFTEDFESGKLSKSWSISENCTQKLESDTVYRPYQAISYSLMGECGERCVMSHTLREPELENMIISDKLAISFVYRATEADYVSCEIHTDKGIYQKTFAPVSLNTWNEITVTVKDFQPTENQGDLAGKKLKGGISFSMCGKGTFIIDNVNISVSKNINIETDKNFIPIYGRDNFAKISVTVYDEYGKETKDGTEVTLSCDNGSFDKNSAKTKNGKTSFIYTPGEKTGLWNITATVDKDTASLPVVTVPGVKTIDFNFPQNTSPDREEYRAKLTPNTKILKFTGNPL